MNKGFKRNKIMKKNIFAGIVLCSMLLSACGTQTEETTSEATAKATAIETMTVTTGEIYNQSELSGQIIANSEVAVMSPLPTKVLSVSVEVGDTVSKDQVLFTLDKTDIQKNHQPLLDEYNRTLELTNASIAQAQKNLDNSMALLEIGAASQLEVEQAELALLQQQVSAASQLSQMDESMKDINTTLTDATVRAPIAGVISAVNVTQNVDATQTSYAVMISENQKPQISVSVSETLIAQIKVGDEVLVAIPSVSSDVFASTIQAIAPNANPQTQLYEVKIAISTENDYQVGMFANVTFKTSVRTDVVTIPSDAILTDGITQYVFIINQSGLAQKIDITTGLVASANTQITSGLEGGETLVVTGQSYLSDGDDVQIVNVIEPEIDVEQTQAAEE